MLSIIFRFKDLSQRDAMLNTKCKRES